MCVKNKELNTKRWLCNGIVAVVTVAALTIFVGLLVSLTYGFFMSIADDDVGVGVLWFIIHFAVIALLLKLERWMCGDGVKLGCAMMYAWTQKEIFDVDDEAMGGIRSIQFRSNVLTCLVKMITFMLGAVDPSTDGLSLSGRVIAARQADVAAIMMRIEDVLMYVAWGLALVILIIEVIGFVGYKLNLRRMSAEQSQ